MQRGDQTYRVHMAAGVRRERRTHPHRAEEHNASGQGPAPI